MDTIRFNNSHVALWECESGRSSSRFGSGNCVILGLPLSPLKTVGIVFEYIFFVPFDIVIGSFRFSTALLLCVLFFVIYIFKNPTFVKSKEKLFVRVFVSFFFFYILRHRLLSSWGFVRPFAASSSINRCIGRLFVAVFEDKTLSQPWCDNTGLLAHMNNVVSGKDRRSKVRLGIYWQ